MPLSGYDVLFDFSAQPTGAYANANLTAYQGEFEVVNTAGGNVLTSSATDLTDYMNLAYSAGDHGTSVKIGCTVAYPDDASQNAIAFTLGATGEGFTFLSAVGNEDVYIMQLSEQELRIRWSTGGSVYYWAGTATNITLAAGDTIEFEMVDNGDGTLTLNVYHNAVVVITVDDTAPLTMSGGRASVSMAGEQKLNSAITELGISGATIGLPVLTLADANLTLGQAFTFNYSNFTQVPVSPLTLTDSQGHTLDVAVTVTDNGDGTGTLTGTMPDLPSSGSSDGVLIGTLTAGIST